MKALDHYYDDAVCTAETTEEMNQLLKEKQCPLEQANQYLQNEPLPQLMPKDGLASWLAVFEKPKRPLSSLLMSK